MPSSRPLTRRQPSQILVLFALVLLVILGLTALVLDGGKLYVQRRTAQASADAAALAGTRALRALALAGRSGVGDTSVAVEICKYATANAFAVVPAITNAEYVHMDGTPAGAIRVPTNCSDSPPPTDVPSSASGVRVSVRVGPYATLLATAVGVTRLSADGHAAAQVGSITGLDADLGPFGVCGDYALTYVRGANNHRSVDILLSDPYRVDPATYGTDIILESAQMSQNQPTPPCPKFGGSSAWKGKLKGGTDGTDDPLITLPSDVEVDNGAGTLDALIRDICVRRTGQLDPNNSFTAPNAANSRCRLLIPITGESAPAGYARVVAFGCFDLYDGGSNLQEWRGVLRDTAACPPIGSYSPTTFGSMALSPTKIALTQ